MPCAARKRRGTRSQTRRQSKICGCHPNSCATSGRKALDLVVKRIESLPGKSAWEGEFRQLLEEQLLEDLPEFGRPVADVAEQAARESLSWGTRFVLHRGLEA